MNKGVTILICTYNGAQRLPETLRHIAAQQLLPGMGCELIVVDNASTDDTVEAIGRSWLSCLGCIELRIVEERAAGLSYARHKGIMAAQYEYVVLCDDDNWLAPDYVQKAFSIMEAQSDIGMLGGHGHFVFETPAPGWLLACNLYAGGPQATASGPVRDHCVYGAGAVLRKQAYERVGSGGFTSALTDRQGHVLSSGGDYELCYVLALAGYTIWYDASLHFHHFITANRLTLTYYHTYIEQSSHCFEVLEPYKIALTTQHRSILTFSWALLKSWGYHAKKMAALLLPSFLTSHAGRSSIVWHLQVRILRYRLLSYLHFRTMYKNFRAVVSLQRQLNDDATAA